MSGDPSNANLWAEADVYVSFDLDAVIPATISTAFSEDWELVGLLDGDAGFSEARSEDVTDKSAWGGILMRTSRKNFKLTKTFTAFENNATTHRLRWPGSVTGTLSVPVVERVMVAFETREGAVKHRLISVYEAEVTVNGDLNENETDVASIQFLATIFPNGDGELFKEQQTA